MTLDQLKQDLFERFISAFDEIGRIAEKKVKAQTTVYSQLPRYDVQKFNGKKILAGGKTLAEPPEMHPITYGLDATGNPCYFSSEHTWNKEYWEGFYDITGSCVECVSFSLQTGMPIEIGRLLFDKGQKIGYQHLRVNGGRLGDTYSGLSNREIAEKLQHSKNDLIGTVELYHYEEQRIVSADCWNAMPGIDNITYKQEYSYNAAGKLEDIKTIEPDNTTHYVYADIPEGVSLEELSDQVAQLIAETIAETLEEVELPHPLAIVELGYHEYDTYYPLVAILLQNKKERLIKKNKGNAIFEALFLPFEKDLVEVSPEKYERLFTAFIDKVMDDDKFELATAMIRKVGYILTTTKIFGKVPVSDNFIAYAVDWSLAPENDTVVEIFRECGMTEKALEQWRKLGVFGHE